MHEFDSVSVSTYEASSLADKLTERSGDGWDIVAIVPTGSDITAFLKRERASSATETDTPTTTAAATATEPAGWGSDAGTSTYDTASSDDSRSWGSSTAAATRATTPTTPSTPNVPPGWYADPAGRYELRYWDGSAWTEHVSRAGQQYTDPPVA